MTVIEGNMTELNFDPSVAHLRMFDCLGDDRVIFSIDDEIVYVGTTSEYNIERLTYPTLAGHNLEGKWEEGYPDLLKAMSRMYQDEGESVSEEIILSREAKDTYRFDLLWDEEITPYDYLMKSSPQYLTQFSGINVFE